MTGSNSIDDEGVRLLASVQVQVGNEIEKPGLQRLHTLKVANSNIGDATVPMIVKTAPNLEHLEIIKCDAIGEFGINHILEGCPNLTYLDISSIPIVNYQFLDDIKKEHPELLIRRNIHQDDDFKKDNGLRVPRRIISKKKKKKKKGKKKKKKWGVDQGP